MKTLTRGIGCLLFAAVCVAAQPSQEDAEVRGLMATFLKAFNDLDWPAFRRCWVDNPVLFHPSVAQNPSGRRVDDVPGFESSWKRQFDLMREAAAKRGVNSPPFANIEAKDLRVDFPAATVAVVTFHLGPNGKVLGRRMFVVAKTDGGWKITHLHASNLALEQSN